LVQTRRVGQRAARTGRAPAAGQSAPGQAPARATAARYATCATRACSPI